MLILSRNKGQKIMINDNIILSVIDIQGDQVRIGIEAPSDVTIYREELFEAIKLQNKDATEFSEHVGDILQKVFNQNKK